MKTKKIGNVSPEERDEIQRLFKRHSGLTDLAKIISADNVELYDKIVNDLGETNIAYKDWWKKVGEKYNWESNDYGKWKIDFETCEIFLITKQ